MKNCKISLLMILLFFGFTAFSQTSNDLIIIDEASEEIQKLNKKHNGKNVYQTKGMKPLAIEQISVALKNSNPENLYIYVLTKPGAIVFNSIAITKDNLKEFTPELEKWKNHISNQVIIYSSVVFNGEDGTLLKERLENITGLVFTTHK